MDLKAKVKKFMNDFQTGTSGQMVKVGVSRQWWRRSEPRRMRWGSSKFHTTHCYFRFVAVVNAVTCLRSLQHRWRNWREDQALLTEYHQGNRMTLAFLRASKICELSQDFNQCKKCWQDFEEFQQLKNKMQ